MIRSNSFPGTIRDGMVSVAYGILKRRSMIKIEKMHVENFPGKDKVLFITDSLESEDAFYMYEHGQLVKQKGYYIYYEKK